MSQAVEPTPSYSVGQRVQFYRKGWEEGKDITLAINGTIRSICPKTGWLTADHKWGGAILRPDEEKIQVLQQKAPKCDPPAEVFDHSV